MWSVNLLLGWPLCHVCDLCHNCCSLCSLLSLDQCYTQFPEWFEILPDRLMNIDSDIRNTLSCWSLQRQCWLSDQVSAWWGPSCMESASPGKPINCEFTSEKFNIDYWPSNPGNWQPPVQIAKLWRYVHTHCTALKLSEIMLLYFPDRMFSFHCLWFLLLLQAADKKSPRTCT